MKLDALHLVYNAAAYFKAKDKFPGGVTEAMAQEGFAGFEATCWMLALLAEQGELRRRDMGYDRQEIRTADYFLRGLGVRHPMEARVAIVEAMNKGLDTGGSEDEEVDEVLLELQKKTGSS